MCAGNLMTGSLNACYFVKSKIQVTLARLELFGLTWFRLVYPPSPPLPSC